MKWTWRWWLVLALLSGFSARAAGPSRWWKGNLHTHSFWSDGDEFPEMIVDWYKEQAYHFLALSDHNILLEGEKWIALTNRARSNAVEKCLARFGAEWIQQRTLQDTQWARLKTLPEFRLLFEEDDRFLLIPSEEISDKAGKKPIHLNATNLRQLIKPQGGSNVLEVMQRNVDAVLAQREKTGLPMFPHLNHPNFGYAITAEELMRLQGDRFFEVYNGHPEVHNEGDIHHASTERMWDIMLAFRLTELKLPLLYGLAVDDSHHYHAHSRKNSNPGRGWVMVRAARLNPGELIAAMEAGDFYASSGVRLKEVRHAGKQLAIEIETEPGITYRTQFIGTRRGFDPASQPGPQPTNSVSPVTRLYSADIGAVLAEVAGASPRYLFTGRELYVRAKVVSSKLKENASTTNEVEIAWTQPVRGPMTNDD